MPARSPRIIHQQAQVSRLFLVILRAKGLCRCQNILNNSRYLHGFHQTVTGNRSPCPTLSAANSDCEAVCEAIFHKVEFPARSDIFFCLKDQLAESGRQKTKENIIPRGKFRPVENDP